MEIFEPPCILTARIDDKSKVFFDEMRSRYFPPERNLLSAHLTLFHKLPDTKQTLQIVEDVAQQPFECWVTALKSIGNGVAYFIESNELSQLHRNLGNQFHPHLSAQDRQTIRPHITIQNKVKPEVAKELLQLLQPNFEPFKITVHGLDLWHYLNGPWKHYRYFNFEAL
ncbi:hypothetical protein ASE74_15150 [Pedobacter sp. Leaf216]|uniref:2'-5' RNA ligase family protein n=1 Tax=Pedobacter sp. Leaf216 TaxID=1735684 RepID=UPI0006F2D4EE|nr:2'-5' RNA ligase family protein [Pedobacter sp. Leaf216]KQM78047.1 hypothetical protein ASE74_15150 [Pedobacter sp. Leaf216]